MISCLKGLRNSKTKKNKIFAKQFFNFIPKQAHVHSTILS